MRPIAVVGAAGCTAPVGDGRTDAELLAPVVDAALAAGGITAAEVGVLCTASSEYAGGIVGSMMDAFDALPGWPPRTHTHLEGDGAFALYEAWARLLAGEADVALVCAYSRPLAEDPAEVAALQLDPYTVGPLGPRPEHLAALQARALVDAGRLDERELATPLRRSVPASGAAAVVLAAEPRAAAPRAWIGGIDQAVESGALGDRDLTGCPTLEALAGRLGVRGRPTDVLEVHAPFGYQEQLVVTAIGAQPRSVNPSGGVLPADPPMVSGLLRVVAAASAVLDGTARRAVAHATDGPCLQRNLLCVLDAERDR